jgi:hypothetical protein
MRNVKTKANTRNNGGNWNHLKGIQKILKQHTGKAVSLGTREINHIWDCTHRHTHTHTHMNCPKHVEFNSKNKFEKLEHLVGFTIRKILVSCLHTALCCGTFCIASYEEESKDSDRLGYDDVSLGSGF